MKPGRVHGDEAPGSRGGRGPSMLAQMLGLSWLRQRRRRRLHASVQIQGSELVTRPPATRHRARTDLAAAECLVFMVCYDGFWGRARALQFKGQGRVVQAVDLEEPALFELALGLATETEADQVREADALVANHATDDVEVRLDLVAFLERLRDHTCRLTKPTCR